MKENLGIIGNRMRNYNIYKFKKQRTALEKGSIEEILAQNLAELNKDFNYQRKEH